VERRIGPLSLEQRDSRGSRSIGQQALRAAIGNSQHSNQHKNFKALKTAERLNSSALKYTGSSPKGVLQSASPEAHHKPEGRALKLES
jgi:hypothetical protein